MTGADDVLSFWFDPPPATESEVEAKNQFWFGGSDEVDDRNRAQFAGLVARARARALDVWGQWL